LPEPEEELPEEELPEEELPEEELPEEEPVLEEDELEPLSDGVALSPLKPPGVPAPRWTVACLELSFLCLLQAETGPSRHLPLQ